MSHEQRPVSETPVSGAWTMMEWFLGIVGGIAAFLGVFLLFAGDDQYVGLGGDLSWRVGDIAPGWAYGLLIGGGVLLLVAIGMFIGARRSGRPRMEPGRGLPGVVWHAGIFAIVNAFVWIQDIALGEGVYAYWVTIPWALGLGIHALVYYFTRGDEVVTQSGESGAEETEEPKRLQRL